jgi:ubiquinone/menaquinone biosynthesis C-methylase UbiE
MSIQNLKSSVRDYWNKLSCGTGTDFISAKTPMYTKQYYDEIENRRYDPILGEPEIFSFAQFTRYQGKRVLEVGVGAGTDFTQWVRAGAVAYGIDLTEQAIKHVKKRLEVYGLVAADVRVGDAENLPYEDETFDLVYSFGVIHHSPDTEKALREIIRVTKKNGDVKLMLYNRRSLVAYLLYLKYGLFAGKPFRTISHILFHEYESKGTKAYTINELKKMLNEQNVIVNNINSMPRKSRIYYTDKPLFLRIPLYLLTCILGAHKCGFHIMIDLRKKG